MKKIKNSQPQTKFTGSYKKKRVQFHVSTEQTLLEVSVSIFVNPFYNTSWKERIGMKWVKRTVNNLYLMTSRKFGPKFKFFPG